MEEDDVRTWHGKAESRGEGLAPGPLVVNMEKNWAIGSRMIVQFDEQDTESESE